MVCGSPVVASADLLRWLTGECDHVVAVDRGLDALLGAGLSCDVYVGDADTVSDAGRALVDAAEAFEVERHDPYKDYTDLALALDSVRRRWPDAEVVATCATGGRPDMALSVLGLLAGYEDPLSGLPRTRWSPASFAQANRGPSKATRGAPSPSSPLPPTPR